MSAPDAKEGPLNEGGKGGLRGRDDQAVLLRAVLDDLKGAARTRLRCRTGESASWARGARSDGEPPREITAFLRYRAPMSTLAGRSRAFGKYAALRAGAGAVRGGRPQHRRLPHDMGAPAPRGAARVREDRAPADAGGRGSRWSTTGGGAQGGAHRGEVSAAAEPSARDFSRRRPPTSWVSASPSSACPPAKVYLSAVVDCYDGRPAGWRIGPRPGTKLANGAAQTPSRPGGRGAHRGAQRPRGPLPVAGVDRDLQGTRARALDVGQGVQPPTTDLRGVLQEAPERKFFHYRDWEASRSRSSPRGWTPTCGTIARGGSSARSPVAERTSTAAARRRRRRKVRKNVRTILPIDHFWVEVALPPVFRVLCPKTSCEQRSRGMGERHHLW